MMHVRLEELSTQMDQFTQSVRSGLDGFLSEWAKLPPEVEKVAADLSGLRQHLAAAAKLNRIVWGGTTLRNNPSLVTVLSRGCRALGREPTFLPEGEFVGALGALEHADR